MSRKQLLAAYLAEQALAIRSQRIRAAIAMLLFGVFVAGLYYGLAYLLFLVTLGMPLAVSYAWLLIFAAILIAIQVLCYFAYGRIVLDPASGFYMADNRGWL